MDKIKVVVVDDSLFIRKVIRDVLDSDFEIVVVGEAIDGQDALEKINQLKPDVVTLDYEMPKLNGLEVIDQVMHLEDRPKIIMVSGFTTEDSVITLRCLEAGAIDFILKPSGTTSPDMYKIREMIIEKVKIAAEANQNWQNKEEHSKVKFDFARDQKGVVVIGASTGGPAALEILLPKFPINFPLPIIVAQHLPAHFTKTFAERVNKTCQLNLVEAYNGQKISQGNIYLTPGGINSEVDVNDKNQIIFKSSSNNQSKETPSVDLVMTSVAKIYGENTIGVILTGMGKDGTAGMEAIKKVGGKTIVQDEESSAIFGMGKEVIDQGLADNVVPLNRIVAKILEIVNQKHE